MSNFIFLTEANSEGPVVYFAIDAEKISEIPESDTYDRFGQSVSAGDAGNYLELKTQKAVEVANIAYHDSHAEWDDTEVLQHFSIGDEILAYEDSNSYDSVVKSGTLEEGVDYDVTSTWVKGFNYWDGHNWKTVVVEREHTGRDNTSHQILDDQELMAELNEAIENKKFVKSEFGKEKYQSDRWEIVVNNFQGSWASYEIREIEEEN